VCRNTFVKKCSGGQKKRLTIAQELASDEIPNIMLLDEPTSGLDSKASHTLIRYLQNLCKNYEIAMIATIHQPSYKLLKLFNDLFIMSISKRLIYYGPTCELPAFLNKFNVAVAEGSNPVDLLMEIASFSEADKYSTESRMELDYCENSFSLNSIDMIQDFTQKLIDGKFEMDFNFNFLFKVNQLFQSESRFKFAHFWLLLKRMATNDILRDPTSLFIRFVVHIVTAFLLMMLYEYNTTNLCLLELQQYSGLNCQFRKLFYGKRYSQEVMTNLISHNLFFLMLVSVLSASLSISSDLKLILNEQRNGWYSTESYFFARSIIEMLLQIPQPIVYCTFFGAYSGQFGFDSFQILFSGDLKFLKFLLIAVISMLATQ
ncbi:hypothetical protein B4U79_03674, partial [Dinothrombium tinctorium]